MIHDTEASPVTTDSEGTARKRRGWYFGPKRERGRYLCTFSLCGMLLLMLWREGRRVGVDDYWPREHVTEIHIYTHTYINI